MNRYVYSKLGVLAFGFTAVAIPFTSCSKGGSGGGGSGRPGLLAPTILSPKFVNTAKTRQEAARQIDSSAKTTKKGFGLSPVMADEGDSTLPSWASEGEDIVVQISQLEDGGDCSKLSANFEQSYAWESSVIRDAVSAFNDEAAREGSSFKDPKMKDGDAYFVNIAEGDGFELGIGSNADLKQSVISITAKESGLSVRQIFLLDDLNKTLTQKVVSSGQDEHGNVIDQAEMVRESIAGQNPKVTIRSSASGTSDGKWFSERTQLTIEQKSKSEFSVNGLSGGNFGGQPIEQNSNATITVGADGKCKIKTNR